jgi:hypothetical protein
MSKSEQRGGVGYGQMAIVAFPIDGPSVAKGPDTGDVSCDRKMKTRTEAAYSNVTPTRFSFHQTTWQGRVVSVCWQDQGEMLGDSNWARPSSIAPVLDRLPTTPPRLPIRLKRAREPRPTATATRPP